VAAAKGVAVRPGGRPDAVGGVFPAVPAGLRPPVETALGAALRPGGRPGAGGGVFSAVPSGLRAPQKPTRGVAPAALAAVGAPHGAVAAGSIMAATVVVTGRRPRAVIPRIGTAADSALPTVPAVVAGAYGAAVSIGRAPVPKVGAGRAGVVVIPLLSPATVRCRPGPVITGRRITVPVGVGR